MKKEILQPKDNKIELIKDQAFWNLKDYVIKQTGLAYYKDKDDDFINRLGKRLLDLGFGSCSDYFEFITDQGKGQEELDRLIIELTIGETYFFRHQEQFDFIRDRILPAMLKINAEHKRLRIWSAGCSTGEEPYSLSILLNETFGPDLKDWDVRILATDVNRQSLSRARTGRYGEWSFRSCPEGFKQKYFKKEGRYWVMDSKYKEWVTFQYHNLVTNPFPSLIQNISSLDVIICRNAMIYFNEEMIKKIVGGFYDSLVDGGWLVTGHAELMSADKRFQINQSSGVTSYRKVNGHSVQIIEFNPIETQRTEPTVDPKLETGGLGSLPVWEPPNITEIIVPHDTPSIKPVELNMESLSSVAHVRQLADQGEWEKAAELCERVIKDGTLDPALHFYYALVLEQMGSVGSAQSFFQKALYLDRNFVMAHYHFGLFFLKKGNLKEACRYFQNVNRLLTKKEPNEAIPASDDMTVADLRELTKMQLEHLEAA